MAETNLNVQFKMGTTMPDPVDHDNGTLFFVKSNSLLESQTDMFIKNDQGEFLRVGFNSQGGIIGPNGALEFFAFSAGSRASISPKGVGYGYTRLIFAEHGQRFMFPEMDSNATTDTSYYILTTKKTISIGQGGTGATDEVTALKNLGGLSANGGTMSGNLIIDTNSLLQFNMNNEYETTLYPIDSTFAIAIKDLTKDITSIYRFPLLNASEGTEATVLTSKSIIPIAQGGTGCTNADDALSSLGGIKRTGDTMTGDLHFTDARSLGIEFESGGYSQKLFQYNRKLSIQTIPTNKINAILTDADPVLEYKQVWENALPTETFVNQTISLINLFNDTKFIVIESIDNQNCTRSYTTLGTYYKNETEDIVNMVLEGKTAKSLIKCTRNIKIEKGPDDTTALNIEFDHAYGENGTIYDVTCIPQKIYIIGTNTQS